MSQAATITRNCTKCSGKGFIRGFGHVDGGECWKCKGVGTFTVTAKSEAARKARAAKAEAKREAEREARWVKMIQQCKADGMTYDEWHADTCYCGATEGHPEIRAQYDAV